MFWGGGGPGSLVSFILQGSLGVPPHLQGEGHGCSSVYTCAPSGWQQWTAEPDLTGKLVPRGSPCSSDGCVFAQEMLEWQKSLPCLFGLPVGNLLMGLERTSPDEYQRPSGFTSS